MLCTNCGEERGAGYFCVKCGYNEEPWVKAGLDEGKTIDDIKCAKKIKASVILVNILSIILLILCVPIFELFAIATDIRMGALSQILDFMNYTNSQSLLGNILLSVAYIMLFVIYIISVLMVITNMILSAQVKKHPLEPGVLFKLMKIFANIILGCYVLIMLLTINYINPMFIFMLSITAFIVITLYRPAYVGKIFLEKNSKAIISFLLYIFCTLALANMFAGVVNGREISKQSFFQYFAAIQRSSISSELKEVHLFSGGISIITALMAIGIYFYIVAAIIIDIEIHQIIILISSIMIFFLLIVVGAIINTTNRMYDLAIHMSAGYYLSLVFTFGIMISSISSAITNKKELKKEKTKNAETEKQT